MMNEFIMDVWHDLILFVPIAVVIFLIILIVPPLHRAFVSFITSGCGWTIFCIAFFLFAIFAVIGIDGIQRGFSVFLGW